VRGDAGRALGVYDSTPTDVGPPQIFGPAGLAQAEDLVQVALVVDLVDEVVALYAKLKPSSLATNRRTYRFIALGYSQRRPIGGRSSLRRSSRDRRTVRVPLLGRGRRRRRRRHRSAVVRRRCEASMRPESPRSTEIIKARGVP
jgi:hypothetical protein